MAVAPVSSEKPFLLYYMITNENHKEVDPYHSSNFDVMIELITDWLCFVRREKNWVGHCLFKTCKQTNVMRQIHRLMLMGPEEGERDDVTAELKDYFIGSLMLIQVHSVSREEFFTPDNPKIEWNLKKSVYTPSLYRSPIGLGHHLAKEAREILKMEHM